MTDPSPESPEAASPRRALALGAAVFALGLALTGFARDPVYHVIASDAPGYLAVARSEPEHSAFDGKLYVLHPPAYPCAVRAAASATGDLVSGGVLLGWLASGALVLVTFRLGLALGFSEGVAAGGALFLASSHALGFVARGVYREPWQVLLTYGLLLGVVEQGGGRARERLRLAGAGVAGALAALTWDPVGLAAPLVALAGWLGGRPRRGLAVGAVVLAVWVGWAGWRRAALVAGPSFPAGIDGLEEATRPLPWAALVNPNFLEDTSRHNAYWWPLGFTPGHVLSLAGPDALASEAPYLDVSVKEQPWLYTSSAATLALLFFIGLGLEVLPGAGEAERARARRVLAVLAAVAFLSVGGLVGKQARYSITLVPLASLLAASGAACVLGRLARRDLDSGSARRRVLVAIGVAGAGLALVGAVRGHFVVARRAVFEGRAPAAVVERLAPAARVAAYVGTPPALAWLLPGHTVLALPFHADRLDAFLAEHTPDLIVVPLEVRTRAGATADESDRALGLGTLAAIASRTSGARPSLVRLGVAVEAEVADEPRLRAWEVVARPGASGTTPAPFGLYLPPGEGDAAARAILAGRVSPSIVAVLKENRAALAASSETRLADLLDKLP